MPTDQQNRKKLALLCDQARKHAKASGLQAFIMFEDMEAGKVSIAPYYGAAMIQSVIAYIASRHPDILMSTIDALNSAVSDVVGSVDGPSDTLDPPVKVLHSLDEVVAPPDGHKPELTLPGSLEP